MFTYKVIKHEDTENGTLYALYETTTDQADSDEVVVMGQTPVNNVFYESLDELVDHVTEIYQYVTMVATGDEPIIDADNVMFVEMEGDYNQCDDDCGCNHDGDFHSLPDSGETVPQKKCCGGSCGCKH